MASHAQVIQLHDHSPEASPFEQPITIAVQHDDPEATLENGALKTENSDGSLTIDLNPDLSDKKSGDKFYDNLASRIDDGELSRIANDLLTGIDIDEQSRKEWLQIRERGITLLGLKLEEPRGDTGTSSAPLEGMSTVRHPLLLEATIRFQATSRGELLPASGPVKVRNDSPPSAATPPNAAQTPQPPLPQGAAAFPPSDQSAPAPPPAPVQPPPNPDGPNEIEVLAEALEKDMNHYLTVTAKEYVPDTDRMLFYVGFGGDGFKKVYNCPLRRRPVSESVDAENIIVSNAATDITNSGRVTHKIRMRPSIIKRMQILGAYRDVSLMPPVPAETNEVEKKKAEIQGTRDQPMRAEDSDYTIFECYCELDLDEFAPKQFKGKGLPLPYRVTMEKESRQILEIRRNWDRDDDQCLAKQFFVQFPFIRGLGFYGLGLIHILGNTTITLTAAWRELLDAGMFANFPGFIYAKQVGRQLTNQFRVPPGGGIPMEAGPSGKISDYVMPLPYKEPGPAFTGFIQHVEEVGQRLGQTADISVGEGKQEAPVGTTLALIEQATKTMDSVHKRLHAAQAEEFGLLKERFQEDPEAFWRHNKKPTVQWQKDQFLKALDDFQLVPVADPNNPTSLHRIAKAMAIKTLQQGSPQLYDAMAVDKRIMRIVGIDPEGLFNATPAPPPPDPRFDAIRAKADAEQMKNQLAQQQLQLKVAETQQDMQGKAADRVSRERIEQLKLQIEQLRLRQEAVIHAHDLQNDRMQTISDIHTQQSSNAADMQMERAKTASQLQMDHAKHASQLHMDRASQHLDLQAQQRQHAHDMQTQNQQHAQKMSHQQQQHEQKLAMMRAQAAAAPKKESP